MVPIQFNIIYMDIRTKLPHLLKLKINKFIPMHMTICMLHTFENYIIKCDNQDASDDAGHKVEREKEEQRHDSEAERKSVIGSNG